MDLYEYIKPELLSLLPLLYIIGETLKKSSVSDWKIPFILGLTGIALATVWLVACGVPESADGLVKLVACGAAQGLLCAGATVYAHNLVKQYGKRNGDEDQ